MLLSANVRGAKEARRVYTETGDVEQLTTRLVRQGARELAAQYAFWIKPVNKGRVIGGGNKRLEDEIRADVARVFKVAENAQDGWAIADLIGQNRPDLKGWAYRLAREGKGEELRKLASRGGVPRGVDEGLFRLMRSQDGRIPRDAAAQAMVTVGQRERFTERRLKRVGLAKASFWQVVRAVSGARLRVGLENGSSVERFSSEIKKAGRGVDAGGATVTPGLLATARIYSRLDYIEEAFAGGGRLNAELRAEAKLEEDVVKALQEMEKRANRALRRAA